MKILKRWSLNEILAAGNVYASDGEAEGGENGNGSAGGAGQSEGSESEETGSAGEESEEEFTPEQMKRKLKALKEEQDRHFKLRKEAERERDDLRKKQEEVDRKGKSELENARADLEAKDKTIASQTDTIRRLTIENAFMGLKEVEWHNPARALSLVDLSEVEFDPETGKVKDPKAVLKAAKALAESDGYLVKPKTDVDSGTPAGKPSGKPPAGKKPNGAGLDEAALRAKYNINR